MEWQQYNYNIAHGVPQHNYFAIVQPCKSVGGLDCSCLAMGIDRTHTLTNPVTKSDVKATLVQRRSCYTDSDNFDSFARIIYGKTSGELLELMKAKYPDMVPEIVEIWVFRKN